MRNYIRIVCYLIAAVFVITIVTIFGYSSYSEPEAPHFESRQIEEKGFVFDHRIDMEILDSLDLAEQKAKEYAAGRLDRWISGLMVRTDSFLDEYFNLLNVKKREVSAAWHTVSHKISKSSPSAEDVIMVDLMARFEEKVLNRNDAQRMLEDIGNNAIMVFIDLFEHGLDLIKEKYSVPEQDWTKHISSLCGYAADFEARRVSIIAKISIASSAVLGAEVAYRIVSSVVSKLGKNLAIKAGTKAASSTGAKALSSAVPVVGLAITAAVIGWDIYDSITTAERNKRDMRAGVEQYFQEMKAYLLGPAQDSIIGSIVLWEKEVRNRIHTR